MDQSDRARIEHAFAKAVGNIRGLDGDAAQAFAAMGVTCVVDEARSFADTLEFSADGSPKADGELDVAMTFPGGHVVHDTFGASFGSVVDAFGLVVARVDWVDFERFVERAAA